MLQLRSDMVQAPRGWLRPLQLLPRPGHRSEVQSAFGLCSRPAPRRPAGYLCHGAARPERDESGDGNRQRNQVCKRLM